MNHPILEYFEFAHLPEFLQLISRDFHCLAHKLVDSHAPSPELDNALRKLLESKDSAVRSFLHTQKTK